MSKNFGKFEHHFRQRGPRLNSSNLAAEFSFRKDSLLAVVVASCVYLISAETPGWALAVAFFCFGWRALIEYRSARIPKTWLMVFFIFLVFLVTYMDQKTLIGRDAAISLLIPLVGLKVLECGRDRDRLFLYLYCLALLGLKLLFQVDIWIVAPILILTLALFYRMLGSNNRAQKFPTLIKHFLISIPLMVVLFLIFPRNQLRFGTGFGISSIDALAQTGFSEEVNPGSVAELVKLKTTAFRAQFKDRTMSTQDLYWRGSVLKDSQGLIWKKTRLGSNRDQIIQDSSSDLTSYQVLLSPHGQNWIFSLDQTAEISSSEMTIRRTTDSYFISMTSIMRDLSYRGKIDSKLLLKASHPEEFLQTPELSENILDFLKPARRLKSRKEKIAYLLQYFSRNHIYTTEPGQISSLDQFLFKDKKGFCEHFAGATATLARSLEIPSRLVIGYQGGTYNRVGDFWTVLQSDAHAWVEFENDQGYWQRIDPTFYVAPQRIYQGASSLEPQGIIASLGIDRNNWTFFALWDEVTFFYENLNYRWNIFLIDFDKTKQREILEAIIRFTQDFGITTLLSVLALIVMTYILKNWHTHIGIKRTVTQKLIQDVQKWGLKQGIQRQPSEPLQQYFNRLSHLVPERKNGLSLILKAYELEIYDLNPNMKLTELAKKEFSTFKNRISP